MTQQVEPVAVPTPGVQRGLLLTAAAVLLVQTASSVWAWAVIPAGSQIPTHWGIDGQPDGWSAKEFGLSFGPVLTVVLTALLILVPRLEPRRAHLASSSKAYGVVGGAILLLLGAVHVVAVLAASGSPVAVGRVVPFGIGVIFAVIGVAVRRIKSNFMFGVRTPWTLTSELSWTRTHLVTGWLWMAVGAAVAVLALLGASGPVLFGGLVGGVVATVLVGFVYSYLIWAKDPEGVGSQGK